MATPPSEELAHLPTKPTLGSISLEIEVKRLFGFIKAAKTPTATWNSAVPVEIKTAAEEWLIPVTEWHRGSSQLAATLAEWRNAHSHAFLPPDPTTTERTISWLANDLLAENFRILFLVEDRERGTVGHIGLRLLDGWRLEVDNVVKSPNCDKPGVMSRALASLGQWCEQHLPVDEIYLRVLSTNVHAIKFYEANRFVVCGTRSTADDSPIDRNQIGQAPVLSAAEAVTWKVMRASLGDFMVASPNRTILTAGPSIGPYEIRLTADAVRSGWNFHHADYLSEFAEQFADYVGAKYAIPTDSCTSALHLSLWALGIGPGDEVIVPNITWVATANAVVYVGATPVFADVDEATWCIDVESARRLISSRTRAIIPVHLYGIVADLRGVDQLCAEFDLLHVQDAAPGIGAMAMGRGIAAFGHTACFSFQGAKMLVSGEGGVMTTNSEEVYRKAQKIADVGRRPGTFWIEELGKKMKMSNVTAALALAQLQSSEAQIRKKRKILEWYSEELGHDSRITFQAESEDTRSTFWMASIRLLRVNVERDSLRSRLLESGIDTRPVFDPISMFPYWDAPKSEHAVAALVSQSSINLPSGVRLTREEVSRVAGRVIEALDSF